MPMINKIQYGMVGGGEGAFIGEIHRMAARLDNHFELVAGAFSAEAERSKRSGTTFGLSKILGSINNPISGFALAGISFLNCGYKDWS